jgi:hypothetical protein
MAMPLQSVKRMAPGGISRDAVENDLVLWKFPSGAYGEKDSLPSIDRETTEDSAGECTSQQILPNSEFAFEHTHRETPRPPRHPREIFCDIPCTIDHEIDCEVHHGCRRGNRPRYRILI